ncbi:MAG: exo-alpha-sialidase [Clostridia bacterium]|nr:exo-alpha-sialidase [Clostridia bacterium]
MKGYNKWSYAPYAPFLWEVGDIYVCRLAPGKDCIHLEWLDAGCENYEICCRPVGEGEFALCGQISGGGKEYYEYDIVGLDEGKDYEFYVKSGEKKSRVRIAKCAEAVGTVVNYLHPNDRCYAYSGNALCSPSLLRHPEGFLLASMDVFTGGSPQNLTLIFRSDDDGKSWHYVSELMPSFWGKMFMHKGEIYMLSVSTEYGDLLIGKSTDGGKTFSAPVSLLRGANGKAGYAGVHKNPQNVVYHNGRIYETLEWGSWLDKGYYHGAMVMSCDENADLLDPENWHFTPPVVHDATWEGAAPDGKAGNIEGTLVVAPDGKLYNYMRYQTQMEKKILVFGVPDDPDAPIEYSHAVNFDGNLSKFMIKRDAVSGKYYSIISRRIDDPKTARNLLSLVSSENLSDWELVCDLIDRRYDDPKMVGFQYVDFEIEGDDIIYLSRTAMNGAKNYHDANYSTFHRIENFRLI